jgi:hypothetical protein
MTSADNISPRRRRNVDRHTPKPRRFLSRRDQADRYGKSVRTIERWGEDPEMGMPVEYDFHGLKARAEDELETWERSRVASKD